MFATPAHAAAPGGAVAGGFNPLWLVPYVLIFIIFYVLLIRPQQRRLKAHQAMIAGVGRGDTVVTTGGLIGKVTRVEEDELELEVGPNVRVRVVKGMLQEVRPHGARLGKDQPAND